MADNLFELVRSRQLSVYEDQTIRTAVQRAVVSEGARGWKIAKEKQHYRIDCVVALGMSALAAVQGSLSGWTGFYNPHAVRLDASGEPLVKNLASAMRDKPKRQRFRVVRYSEQEALRLKAEGQW
jgi:hypothetical protein